MSSTLNAPWIADYLINIAETHGCSISNVLVHDKPGKKVQILQFLTFREFAEDDCVWAYVSDKHQKIAVRFSRLALNEYDKISEGNRLTQQRSAVATIQYFKPIFQRIPTGTVGEMSVSETLALNVDSVKILGAAGEPEFGSPRTLDNHDELNDWIEGLRTGDGSGNILKQRKEKRLAQERGKSSVTETPPIYERCDRPSKRVDIRHHAVQSEHRAYAGQEDWRESIAKKPLRFYKRPTGNSVTGPKPLPTVPVQKNGGIFKSANGALDRDNSPDVINDSYDGGPSLSKRQTTPSEWPTSPERSHIPVSPGREVADQLLISPPSTPPLFTQELPQVVGQSTLGPGPAGDHDPQATPEAVQHLRRSVPTQRRTQSVPLPFPSSAVSSVISNPRHKATSLPTDVFGSTVSRTRRVPPPSAKITKEPCGEVLVPGSDSGGPDSQSTQNNSSPSQRRATISARPERVNTSLRRMSSSPERVNEAHDAPSSVLEPGLSQEPDKGQLDELSRMALNGSYADHVRGNGVQTHNGMWGNRRDAAKPDLPSPEPELSYEQLPPSSLPIYSQSLDWDRSMAAAEETAVVEETPLRVTTQHLPTSTTKRVRPSTPSPPRGKRPRLMSREPVDRSHERYGAAPRKAFDPELLRVGIEVDLTDYDGNPPLYPCKEGMPRLSLKQMDNPLLITNSKLAEIWKSVCKYRGWCGTQSSDNLSKVSS